MEVLIYNSKLSNKYRYAVYKVLYLDLPSYIERGKRHYLARVFFEDGKNTSDVFIEVRSSRHGSIVDYDRIPEALKDLIKTDYSLHVQ